MHAKLYCEYNKITVDVDDPLLWDPMRTITGKVKEVHPGKYEMQLSVQNLQRLRNYFGEGARIITGQEHIDKLKNKLTVYKGGKTAIAEIKAKERYPMEPNGKLVPYAHQTKIFGCMDAYPFMPVIADCGTGKTPVTAASIEYQILKGRITPGKVLISSPLSILNTAWYDDITRFTGLKAKLVRTDVTNKDIVTGDIVVLRDYGPPPPNALTVKKKKVSRLVNRYTKEFTDKLLPIDDPKAYDRMRVQYGEATLLDGTKIPVGQAVGFPIAKNTDKLDAIKDILKDPDIDVFLINHDGVRIYEPILTEHNFEWVIIDESTKIKSPTSQIFDSHVAISRFCKRRNILTGTPNPNGFEDLWAQFYFLDRGLTLEPSYKDFLSEYFVPQPVSDFQAIDGKMRVKYVLKDAATRDRLIERVRSIGIFLRQRDCVDLPPRTDVKRIVTMTPVMQKAYEDMESKLIAELVDEKTGKRIEASAKNALAKLMKLRQITSGFLINTGGDDEEPTKLVLSDNPKLSDLDEFLDNLGDQKVVICAQFREEIKTLLERYKDWNPKAIMGNISEAERTEAIRNFQTTNDSRMMVLQPAAASHGITLTESCNLVFLSLDYNFEYYYQIAKRVERIGQRNPIFITHLLARFADGSETIDDSLVQVLAKKNRDRETLFGNGDLDDDDSVADELVGRLLEQRSKRNAAKHD